MRGKSKEEIINTINQNDLAEASECLIEGSAKDNVSHFTLRLLCASDGKLQNFFITSETELLIYRLQFYDNRRIKQMLRDACMKSVKILKNGSFIASNYKSALQRLIQLAQEVKNADRNDCIKVHFSTAPKFVSCRSFPLEKGYLQVPSNKLTSILPSIFEEIVLQGIKQMKESVCFQELKDPRINSMRREIKMWFYKYFHALPLHPPKKREISLNELQAESKKFPLCMANLHAQLTKNHRLIHASRIQYTLFLKEIGLPCEDTINLFMEEYSLPHVRKSNGASSCGHSWNESKNRYVYSIEHLFGRRGSAKDYAAHSCHSLQVHHSDSINEGGCPFVSCDVENLEKMLTYYSPEATDIEDIKSLVVEKEYKKACSKHLQNRLKVHHAQNAVSSSNGTSKIHLNRILSDSSTKVTNCDKSMPLNQANLHNSDSLVKYSSKESTTDISSIFNSPSTFYFLLSSSYNDIS